MIAPKCPDVLQYAKRRRRMDRKSEYCNYPNCAGAPVGYSLCQRHYSQALRQLKGQKLPPVAKMLIVDVPFNPSRRTCSLEGCFKPHQARGYCQTHSRLYYRRKREQALEQQKVCKCECVCGARSKEGNNE